MYPDKLTVNRAVGEILKRQRIALNFTTRALAPKVGVSYQSIQKYEKGEMAVPMHRLFIICAVFGWEPQEFMNLLTCSLQIKDEFRQHGNQT